MNKWLQKEKEAWNRETKIKEWMPMCLMAFTLLFGISLNVLSLWFSNELVDTSMDKPVTACIMMAIGFGLLVVYAWHYYKLNPKEPK
jgi:F0F1-type ATP synthase membrane subunit a